MTKKPYLILPRFFINCVKDLDVRPPSDLLSTPYNITQTTSKPLKNFIPPETTRERKKGEKGRKIERKERKEFWSLKVTRRSFNELNIHHISSKDLKKNSKEIKKVNPKNPKVDFFQSC